MPRRVDHEQRRREITAALWRIAADRGLEGVSLGQVAVEAGMSKGLVQYYFVTRDQMLVHATGHLRERIEARIAGRLAAVPEPRAPHALLRAVLVALLPLDAESRLESLVANALLIRALKDPPIAARFREGHVRLRDGIGAMIRAAQRDGDLAAGLDPDQEADILVAIVGGVGEGLLLDRHTPASARATLDYHLDRLASPRR